MKLDMNCIPCNVNQVIRICGMLALEDEKKESLMRAVLAGLADENYGKCNPEVMADTWDIIVRHTGNPDPYREIRTRFNQDLLALLPELETRAAASPDPFLTALKIAVAGNLIDFAMKSPFTPKQLMARIAEVDQNPPAIDHAERLRQCLSTASTLLYLGDNCGEIVLDKLFIRVLRDMYPNLHVTFAVRGKPILNDVTEEDAEQVGMYEVAGILANGDGSPGTVLHRTTPAFRTAYAGADVIIAKGQGNFESLSESGKPGLFHLFMAKCEPVAKLLDVSPFSIVCMENPGHGKAASASQVTFTTDAEEDCSGVRKVLQALA